MEGDKSSSTFCDKSGDAVLLATPNLWDNIQIVRTYILKYNVPNSVSLVTRHLNFETYIVILDKFLIRSCVIFLTMLKM